MSQLNSRDKLTNNKTLLQLITPFFKQYPLQTFGVILALFLSGLMESLGLLTLLPVLDMTLNKGAVNTEDSWLNDMVVNIVSLFGFEPTLGILLSLMALTLTLKAILHLSAMGYVGFVMAQIATDLRFDVINSTLNAKWSFFVSKPIGYFTNAVNSEAGLSSSLYMAICNFISTFTHVLLFSGLALLLNLDIAVWAMAAGVVMLFTLGRLVNYAKRAGEQQAVAMKGLVRILTDSLQGIKALKVMGLERFMTPLLEAEVSNLKYAQRKQVLAKHSLGDLREPFIVIFVCLGLYFAIEKMGLEMSGLIVMALIFHRVLNSVGMLQQNYQQIRVVENFYRSLQQTVEEAQNASEIKVSGQQCSLNKSIVFKDVQFLFGENIILEQESFEIKSGSLTAIVGPSGAGKTTLMDVIIGLYKPEKGNIYIDGIEVNDIDVEHWRHNIGYVPQELFLFHDTVLNNITLGDQSINSDQVNEAVEKAGASMFVKQLPQGLDTMIGERGVRLSGGQRQRIAIARALVRNPQLLILDEATTALDPDTEKKICDTISKLDDEITIIAISHQDAIVNIADRVLHIEQGKVTKKDACSEK